VNEVLEPLVCVPGVRLAALATLDGVPIACRGELEGSDEGGGDALAGLVAGWLASLEPSLGLMSWDAPQRIVLKCTRGTLVVRRTASANLLVVLEPGTSAEELRLPVEAALARLQRVARRTRAGTSAPEPALPLRNAKGPHSARADNDPPSRTFELPG
jgi:predicted regulator of Ras-like GTPase activity (Roadblock/LC7/MglB family)